MKDYHLHTSRCGHARGSMRDYVAMARVRGLREIGFADHLPMYWLPPEQRDPGLAMAMEELPGYITEVQALREENPDLVIRLGIEADYIPGREGDLRDLLAAYPFEYVLGSVHFIDGWGFDNPALVEEYRQRDIGDIYRAYFDLVQRAALSGLFNIMAHPDLVKKFGFRPAGELVELYDDTARAFHRAGVIAEVNTAGLRAPVGEIYPGTILLQAFCRQQVPFALGSDAHTPEQVGAGLAEARDLVVKLGGRFASSVVRSRKRLVLLTVPVFPGARVERSEV